MIAMFCCSQTFNATCKSQNLYDSNKKNNSNTWYFSFRKLLSIHYVNSSIENDIYQSTVICKRRHCNLCVKLLLARCQYDDEDDNGDTCKISNNAIIIKDVAPSSQLRYYLDHSTELDKTLSYCLVILFATEMHFVRSKSFDELIFVACTFDYSSKLHIHFCRLLGNQCILQKWKYMVTIISS